MHVPDFRTVTVEELARRVRGRELTAAAVIDAALERIDKINPVLNAFVIAARGSGSRSTGTRIRCRERVPSLTATKPRVPSGTKSVGVCDRRATDSATDPRIHRAAPSRPSVASTIRSVGFSSRNSRQAATGLRSREATFVTRTANRSKTAERGLPSSSSPQRSSVERTAGKRLQLSSARSSAAA